VKKILITSVGSLVSQNILDLLESRRSNLKIIGIDSSPESQRIYRCDSAYLVPMIDDIPAFERAFHDIFISEQPDMVLAGRDHDVVFLAKYKEAHPEVDNRITCGDSYTAQMMQDKFESFRFASKFHLPFANSFLYKDSNDIGSLNLFIEKHGFPIVIKPRFGFGSLNVFFATHKDQIEGFIQNGSELLFQEYLGSKKVIDDYYPIYKRAMPLFFQIPRNDHFAVQSVISPDGKFLRSITTQHSMIMGRTESSKLFHDESINLLVKAYVEALASDGWRGFVNLQIQPDWSGIWKVYEMNPRMAGGCSSRLMLGFDELAILINSWFPDWDFPDLSCSYKNRKGYVLKYLTDYFVEERDVDLLREKKTWERLN
jgi:carbamoyl-phosphate synthase large subunit